MARDYQQILDAVLAGVVVVDGAGGVERVNAAACRILEISQSSIVGRPVEDLLGPGHALGTLARRVLETSQTAVESDQRVERRGGDLVIDVAASPLFTSAGRLDGVVLMLRDRTIQQRLQDVVAERERLSSLGQVAEGLAHEVKNPLGGIRGAAELLSARGERAGDPKTCEAARLIVREVDRIAKLVDDLMVFGKGDALRLAPANVHRILDGVLDLLRHDSLGEGVTFERAYDPSIPELLIDADRLTQVFLNLGRNALQALATSTDRRELRIETSVSFERIVTPEGDALPSLVVVVEDSGEGIPNELLDQVATPFFTTREHGTGLGLGIAQHWVALHAGELQIESVRGEGTRVRVSLPLRRLA